MASKSAAKSKASGKRRAGSKKKSKLSGHNLKAPESIRKASGHEAFNHHSPYLDTKRIDEVGLEEGDIAVTLLLMGGHEYHLILAEDSTSLKQLFSVFVEPPEKRCDRLFQLPVYKGPSRKGDQEGLESSLCFTGDRLVGIVTNPPIYIQQPDPQEPTSDSSSFSQTPEPQINRAATSQSSQPSMTAFNPISNPIVNNQPDNRSKISADNHYAVVVSPERENHLAPGVIPSRYIQLTNFLSSELHRNVLDYALDQQSSFIGSSTSTGDLDYRQSSVLHYFPEFADMMRGEIHRAFADVIASLQINPFDITQVEAQLTAHNDGHYYKVHNDNGSVDTATRVLTYVYYFHRDPKPFAGGALRIYDSRIQNNYYVQAESFQDITPINNSIVFFPSHYMHEVLPIICPNRQFADSRFTINGWVRR